VYVSKELMRGQSLGAVVSRVRRQETALELAERHGLELDAAKVEPLSFTSIESGPGISVPTTEAPVMAETASENMGTAEAQRLIDAERDRIIAEQNREHAREVASLQTQIEVSKLALERHENSHPGRMLFGGKARESEWQETRKSLQVEYQNHQRAIDRLESSFGDGREYREFAARKGANERLPKAASVLSTGKAQESAKALVGRWQSLESTLAGLGVNSNSSDAQRVHTDLHQVLQQNVKAPDPVKSAISTSMRAEIDAALARSEKSMERAQARDRGLDR